MVEGGLKMIIDVTGVVLTPGNNGDDCLGNWEHEECCCDECAYMLCCVQNEGDYMCADCDDLRCPRSPKNCDK